MLLCFYTGFLISDTEERPIDSIPEVSLRLNLRTLSDFNIMQQSHGLFATAKLLVYLFIDNLISCRRTVVSKALGQRIYDCLPKANNKSAILDC